MPHISRPPRAEIENPTTESQSLLQQTGRELNIEVAILSEQYRNLDTNPWVSEAKAIWTCRKHSFQELKQKSSSLICKGKSVRRIFLQLLCPTR